MGGAYTTPGSVSSLQTAPIPGTNDFCCYYWQHHIGFQVKDEMTGR